MSALSENSSKAPKGLFLENKFQRGYFCKNVPKPTKAQKANKIINLKDLY
jgi:hypothetical protein